MNALNQHPDVRITEETRVLNAVTLFMDASEHGDFAQFGADRWNARLRAEMPALVERFYREDLGIDVDALRWGDKNPHYVDRRINRRTLERIGSMWEDAMFVNIVRDGRDVVSSLVKLGWIGPQDAANLWMDSLEYARDFESTDSRMLTVKYENICSGETKLSEIHSFLDLNPDLFSDSWQLEQQASPTPFRRPTSLREQHSGEIWTQADGMLNTTLREWGYK